MYRAEFRGEEVGGYAIWMKATGVFCGIFKDSVFLPSHAMGKSVSVNLMRFLIGLESKNGEIHNAKTTERVSG